MNEQNKVCSSTIRSSTRVKMSSWKKTVGITLPRELIERAREHSLNLSRITEQALSSILDYLEPENDETSSDFLKSTLFQKES
jgi:post-segregation antitoxin (ccd killing protein)